jgi:hypothetical protein
MKEWSPLTIGLAAGAAAALAGIGALAYRKLRRRKDPAELERLRRLSLSRAGRIATGEVIGLVEPEGSSALLLVYRYDVAGVTYEVAQDVAPLAAIVPLARRALGGITTIRYEMKHPGNSIIASEEWSGLPEIKPS